jgi:thioredoxin-related protein
MKKYLFFFLLFIGSAGFAQEVEWYSIEEAVVLNSKEPKKMMIDVYTTWCGWCKVMDRNTFSDKNIAEYLNTNFYPVKLNAEQKEVITIGDKNFEYVTVGNRGYNELAVYLLQGQMGFPSVVFLDEEGKLIGQPFQGYKDAKAFDELMKYIGEEKYKTN